MFLSTPNETAYLCVVGKASIVIVVGVIVSRRASFLGGDGLRCAPPIPVADATLRVVASPFKFSDFETNYRPPPLLGEHTSSFFGKAVVTD